MKTHILTSRRLQQAGIAHGFTTRQAGDVLGSLRGWEQATGLSEAELVRLNQVHSTDVLVVDRPRDELASGQVLSYDASVTQRNDVVLSVRTADCVPILLYGPEPEAIGVVHAGWRGTLAGTITHAVHAMQSAFGCEPESLVAAIGPSIRTCCYRVGEDVYRQFLDRFGSEAVAVLSNEWYAHLVAVNRIWLIECGVSTENIEILDCCTSCRQDLFFSHRRDGATAGRQMAYITLKPSD